MPSQHIRTGVVALGMLLSSAVVMSPATAATTVGGLADLPAVTPVMACAANSCCVDEK